MQFYARNSEGRQDLNRVTFKIESESLSIELAR